MNPIQLFTAWFNQELELTKVSIPTACCLSTIGLDNYPNARFVSLKKVIKSGFIITGPLASRKGREINHSNKIALTFWWTETERQIRIQGSATIISEKLADKYFAERNRDSQIVSMICEQGKEVDNMNQLIENYERTEKAYAKKILKRPENWGGYLIEPIRIEFLEFKKTRFHHRKLYELAAEKWIMKQIQP